MDPKIKTIQSVVRAFSILEQFTKGDSALGVTAIASRAGLHKSTCFGLLNTLQHLGYVIQNPDTGLYGLGLKAFELGQAYIVGLDLRDVTRPFLLDIVEKTQETVHLVVLEGRRAIYIDKVESPHAMTISSRIGQEALLHCTGVGKALLAHMPEDDRAAILAEGLKPYTEFTLADGDSLLKHLETVRAQGYAIDDQEREIGLNCVAAPIFDAQGKVIAAISISGPTHRADPEKMEERCRMVGEAARQISRRLGYRS